MLFSYLAHVWTRKPEAILKLTLAQHQQMKMVLKYKEQLLKGTKSKKTVKRFHPLGRTTEQLEFKWNNLKWSPQLESIEDYVQKINQLATALGKTEPDKVLKLKMSAPNQNIYLFIMTCTTTEEIAAQSINFRPCHIFSNPVLQDLIPQLHKQQTML